MWAYLFFIKGKTIQGGDKVKIKNHDNICVILDLDQLKWSTIKVRKRSIQSQIYWVRFPLVVGLFSNYSVREWSQTSSFFLPCSLSFIQRSVISMC